MLWRMVPLASVLSFVALTIFWRMWSQRRRYGTLGVLLFQSDTPKYHVRDALLVSFFVLVTLQAVLVAFLPGQIAAVGPVRCLEGPALRMLGFWLAIAGTVLLVIGQEQLGSSWRVGVDDATRPGLRTDGMYAFCRNPIYVFWWIWTVGYLLLVPTWMSVLVLLALTLAIHWYIEEEEEYLTRAYGDLYRAYGRRVGRFLPRVGRFPKCQSSTDASDDPPKGLMAP
jgi:protein-S-isoprenylcysteine O-methyltransferase Ste14